MQLLNVKSVPEAVTLTRQAMENLSWGQSEMVPIERAAGRILAETVVAEEDLPAFRRSTMDGYAVRSADTNGASDTIPTVLKIVERIEMGEVPEKSIASGEASIIFTGGMLPDGADAVVPVEVTEKLNDKNVAIYQTVRHLENVVDVGEDVKAGTLYFTPGTRLSPTSVAALASIGKVEVAVVRAPRVFLFSTGDEIVPASTQKVPLGKTRDINRYALEALCRQLGFPIAGAAHLTDVREGIEKAFAEADADLILVSGSSSQGEKDFVPRILDTYQPGSYFHGVSIKPGKPLSLASDGRSLFLGLPGHPVSSISVFLAVFETAWRLLIGAPEPATIPCRLTQNVVGSPGKTKVQFVRVDAPGVAPAGANTCAAGHSAASAAAPAGANAAAPAEPALPTATPLYGPSGNVSIFTRTQGYFLLPDSSEGLNPGDVVQVRLFSEM